MASFVLFIWGIFMVELAVNNVFLLHFLINRANTNFKNLL